MKASVWRGRRLVSSQSPFCSRAALSILESQELEVTSLGETGALQSPASLCAFVKGSLKAGLPGTVPICALAFEPQSRQLDTNANRIALCGDSLDF